LRGEDDAGQARQAAADDIDQNFTRSTGRPIRRLASSLPPIASTVRPALVKLSTIEPTI
jgi:hypothetical protein